ncbi:MAG: DUF3306 domain-containing protein [Rhodospirillaceae bacterium]
MSGGFLSRWARLKAETQAPEAAPEMVPLPEAEALPGVPEDAPPEPEAPPFDPADLPDIDSLTADSDYSMFMNAQVPEDLRNRALRKLWTSDPVYAVRDGLLDYDEDFTAPTLVGTAVRTVYDAVRGYEPPEEAEEVTPQAQDELAASQDGECPREDTASDEGGEGEA